VTRRLASGSVGRVLQRLLIVFVAVPSALIWFAAGAPLFGYGLVGVNGSSMEPALHDGDGLWLRSAYATDVRVGDILVLEDADGMSVVHRATRVERLSPELYLIQTKGDANQFAEWWELRADEEVKVSLTRLPLLGRAIQFLEGYWGRGALLGGTALLLLTVVVRRRLHAARKAR